MKNKIRTAWRQSIICGCIAAAVCFAPVTEAQVLFSQDFDAQTTGSTASGFTLVSPTTATALPTGRGGVIVDEGGGDKAVNIYDYDTAGNVRLEQDFTPLSLCICHWISSAMRTSRFLRARTRRRSTSPLA